MVQPVYHLGYSPSPQAFHWRDPSGSTAFNQPPNLDTTNWSVLQTRDYATQWPPPPQGATSPQDYLNLYRYWVRDNTLWRRLTVYGSSFNPPPASGQPDNADWARETFSTWSAVVAYPQNAIVTHGSPAVFYTATNAVPAPGSVQTYTQVFNYAAGGNTAGTQNVAHYVGSAGFASSFPSAVCVNIAHNALLVAGNTFRLRRASGTSAATTGVTGVLTKQTAPYGGANYVCFRIGSAAAMTAAFGTADTTSGANWILESVTSAPPQKENDYRLAYTPAIPLRLNSTPAGHRSLGRLVVGGNGNKAHIAINNVAYGPMGTDFSPQFTNEQRQVSLVAELDEATGDVIIVYRQTQSWYRSTNPLGPFMRGTALGFIYVVPGDDGGNVAEKAIVTVNIGPDNLTTFQNNNVNNYFRNARAGYTDAVKLTQNHLFLHGTQTFTASQSIPELTPIARGYASHYTVARGADGRINSIVPSNYSGFGNQQITYASGSLNTTGYFNPRLNAYNQQNGTVYAYADYNSENISPIFIQHYKGRIYYNDIGGISSKPAGQPAATPVREYNGGTGGMDFVDLKEDAVISWTRRDQLKRRYVLSYRAIAQGSLPVGFEFPFIV